PTFRLRCALCQRALRRSRAVARRTGAGWAQASEHPAGVGDDFDGGSTTRELVHVLDRQKARARPVARHRDIRGSQPRGDLLKETLELNRRSSVDLLLDLEVRPLEARSRERLGANEERVGVEHAHRRRIELGWKTVFLEDLELAFGMNRDAAFVTGLRA